MRSPLTAFALILYAIACLIGAIPAGFVLWFVIKVFSS